MAGIELSELGLSKQELTDRVVEAIAEHFLSDDDYSRLIDAKVNKMVVEQIDAAVEQLGDKIVGPRVAEMVETQCLQATNHWGEKTGDPLTFIEYLVQRAEGYLTEKVNHNGESREEARDTYQFKGAQTRVAHMVDAHIQYSISVALKKALESVNSQISQGIAETVKTQLAEILERLSVGVLVR